MTGCACGHHHHHHAPLPSEIGEEIALTRPLKGLRGRLICADMGEMLLAMNLLPDHIAASRAEPGCLRFDIAQGEDPLIWELNELFTGDEAFAAHQARTKLSRWGRDSAAIRRDFTAFETLPRIRPETRFDHEAIAKLNREAFGGDDEAKLIAALRANDDLALSLLAETQNVVLGHIALSPLKADTPALALAPVAVHPAVQGRGIGAALVRAALAAFADHTIVVLGDPAYYARFGFTPADLISPYAGPCLQSAGPALRKGSAIVHAPAFATL